MVYTQYRKMQKQCVWILNDFHTICLFYKCSSCRFALLCSVSFPLHFPKQYFCGFNSNALHISIECTSTYLFSNNDFVLEQYTFRFILHSLTSETVMIESSAPITSISLATIDTGRKFRKNNGRWILLLYLCL